MSFAFCEDCIFIEFSTWEIWIVWKKVSMRSFLLQNIQRICKNFVRSNFRDFWVSEVCSWMLIPRFNWLRPHIYLNCLKSIQLGTFPSKSLDIVVYSFWKWINKYQEILIDFLFIQYPIISKLPNRQTFIKELFLYEFGNRRP